MWRHKGLARLCIFLFVCFLTGLSYAQDGSAPRLLIFEGSDWCSNCLRLEKEVLSDPQFEEFQNTYDLVIERVDFPQRKQLEPSVREYNELMAERYGFTGEFPTVLLLDESGELISPIRYRKQDVFEFIALLKPHIEM